MVVGVQQSQVQIQPVMFLTDGSTLCWGMRTRSLILMLAPAVCRSGLLIQMNGTA